MRWIEYRDVIQQNEVLIDIAAAHMQTAQPICATLHTRLLVQICKQICLTCQIGPLLNSRWPNADSFSANKIMGVTIGRSIGNDHFGKQEARLQGYCYSLRLVKAKGLIFSLIAKIGVLNIHCSGRKLQAIESIIIGNCTSSGNKVLHCCSNESFTTLGIFHIATQPKLLCLLTI